MKPVALELEPQEMGPTYDLWCILKELPSDTQQRVMLYLINKLDINLWDTPEDGSD